LFVCKRERFIKRRARTFARHTRGAPACHSDNKIAQNECEEQHGMDAFQMRYSRQSAVHAVQYVCGKTAPFWWYDKYENAYPRSDHIQRISSSDRQKHITQRVLELIIHDMRPLSHQRGVKTILLLKTEHKFVKSFRGFAPDPTISVIYYPNRLVYT
jgi:hypothetical protein